MDNYKIDKSFSEFLVNLIRNKNKKNRRVDSSALDLIKREGKVAGFLEEIEKVGKLEGDLENLVGKRKFKIIKEECSRIVNEKYTGKHDFESCDLARIDYNAHLEYSIKLILNKRYKDYI